MTPALYRQTRGTGSWPPGSKSKETWSCSGSPETQVGGPWVPPCTPCPSLGEVWVPAGAKVAAVLALVDREFRTLNSQSSVQPSPGPGRGAARPRPRCSEWSFGSTEGTLSSSLRVGQTTSRVHGGRHSVEGNRSQSHKDAHHLVHPVLGE